ncbi:uncharacterized protein LOC131944121, partial [Physella acuta]|uniref:uncharacterized protein LOC131944121 n=1 Tax=Physella acuta TaxID=109671 RepID=UPI0027DDA1E7
MMSQETEVEEFPPNYVGDHTNAGTIEIRVGIFWDIENIQLPLDKPFDSFYSNIEHYIKTTQKNVTFEWYKVAVCASNFERKNVHFAFLKNQGFHCYEVPPGENAADDKIFMLAKEFSCEENVTIKMFIIS